MTTKPKREMSEEEIDAGARAICAHDFPDSPCSRANPPCDTCRGQARAAIRAARVKEG